MNHPSACICVFCKSCIPEIQDQTVNSSDWFSHNVRSGQVVPLRLANVISAFGMRKVFFPFLSSLYMYIINPISMFQN